jgi:signal transduction histidine kinase
MGSRSLTVVLLLLGAIGASLAACLSFGLPALAVAPPEVQGVPLWTCFAPFGGSLVAATLVVWRNRAPAELLGDLPGQTTLAFALAAVGAVLLGVLLEPHPLIDHRRAAVLVCAPATVLAHAMVLRFAIQGPLMAEMSRLILEGRSKRPGSPRAPGDTRSRFGVLGIRPMVTLTTMALCALGVATTAIHAYSRALREQEVISERHLVDLLRVAQAQVEHLPPTAMLRQFFAAYPPGSLTTTVLLDAAHRTLSSAPGIPQGARMATYGRSCTVGDSTFRCATDILPGGGHLAVVALRGESDDASLSGLRLELWWLGAGLLLVAGVLGWAFGNDASRDFRVMTNQLRAMATQDEPDLGRPLTVVSIDEIGDLTAALGEMRVRLETEIAAYQESLRKAKEADRIKSMFFSDVSHELRTPLTTICGYAQMMLEGMAGDLSHRQREDVRVVYQSGQQLLGLINDVLDISVIESGHLALTLESVDLGTLCREGVRAHSAAAHKKTGNTGKTIALSLEMEENLPWIVADPLRVRQVLHNLLSNALKFTTEGSVIVRVMRHGPQEVALEVQDTGAGISGVDIGLIFDRYRQAGSLQARRLGSGLGLGICRHLVELHDGTISAESEMGRGSTFTVVLPTRGPRDRGARPV